MHAFIQIRTLTGRLWCWGIEIRFTTCSYIVVKGLYGDIHFLLLRQANFSNEVYLHSQKNKQVRLLCLEICSLEA